MQLRAAITSDIDTLNSIYHGIGCRRDGGYTYTEFQTGMENFRDLLEPYEIKATLFMVGNDFRVKKNIQYILAMKSEGHEIANHTNSHAQAFRLLQLEEKEAEIAEMEKICLKVTGEKPVGFRCAGWNISNDAVPILKQRGYLYDSSVHPTSITPLFKFLQWLTNLKRTREEQTTFGNLQNMFSPAVPYICTEKKLAKRGLNGIIEFPLTVTPFLRLPFYATFLLATGMRLFKISYQIIKNLERPIIFSFHLSDFVDYFHPDLINQVPTSSDGVYVPQALRTPLKKKIELFRKAIEWIAKDYSFITLKEWAYEIRKNG
ncbi:MAG TPA: polysaccharide deacetylase family protein [Anaerolineae bacterium]|nr:polysaccharide deacetylase family protein [Anaerolineae bacterium]